MKSNIYIRLCAAMISGILLLSGCSDASDDAALVVNEQEASAEASQDADGAREGDEVLIGISDEKEPHEHEWIEADFNNPKTCSICGETEGEPLKAEMADIDVEIHTDFDTDYDYTTLSGDMENDTTGTVQFCRYDCFLSDADHEELEGYAWSAVTLDFAFYDEAGGKNGGLAYIDFFDYYYATDSCALKEENEEGDQTSFSVNYNGNDYSECLNKYEVVASGFTDDGGYRLTVRYWLRLPLGYDGLVFEMFNPRGIMNSEDYSVPDGLHFDDVPHDGLVLFRLPAADPEQKAPYFELHNIKCTGVLDQEYPYTTLCKENEGVEAIGTVAVTDYKVIRSDKGHEEKEGYVWQVFNVEFHYDDENAYKYGVENRSIQLSYYEGDDYWFSPPSETSFSFRGRKYPNWGYDNKEILDNWDDSTHRYDGINTMYMQVPEGYDGTVVMIYNSKGMMDSTHNFTQEDTPLFELVNDGMVFVRLPAAVLAEE